VFELFPFALVDLLIDPVLPVLMSESVFVVMMEMMVLMVKMVEEGGGRSSRGR